MRVLGEHPQVRALKWDSRFLVDVGGEREPAAAVGVADRREDGWRVEVGQRQPVDRAVAGDERHRAPIADHGVAAQRRVAIGPLCHRCHPSMRLRREDSVSRSHDKK
jgi:hypothetical protein